MEGGKNRRSSILKPQKARNPLSDVDLIETDVQDSPESIASRALLVRRVSFASSNFVKEFATDPEKNTIWDTTYEETIKSDSLQSSSENTHNTLGMQHTQNVDSMQITKENIHIARVEEIQHDVQVSKVTKEISLSSNLIQQSSHKKNLLHFNDARGEDILIDLAMSDINCSKNRIIEKENIQPQTNIKGVDTGNNLAERESSPVLQVPLINENQFHYASTKNSRDYFMPVSQVVENAQNYNNNLKFQSSITAITNIQYEENKPIGPTSFSGNMRNTIIAGKSVEFTQVEVLNKIETINTVTTTSNESMEFTTPMNTFNIVNLNKMGCNSVENKTLAYNGESDFGKNSNENIHVSVIQNDNVKHSELHKSDLDDLKNVVIDNENIHPQINIKNLHVPEGTNENCLLSNVIEQSSRRKTSLNFNDEGGEDILTDSTLSDVDCCKNRIIENANILPRASIESIGIGNNHAERENSPVVQAPLINEKQFHYADTKNSHGHFVPVSQVVENAQFNSCLAATTIIQDKENIPIHTTNYSGKNYENKRHTIIADEDMEFTRVEELNKTKAMNIESPTFDESMELTTPLEAFSLAKCEVMRNKTVLNDDNMEFTQSVPILCKMTPKVGTNKTVMYADTMDFTQNIAALCKTNSKVKRNETIMNVDTMELTREIVPICKTKPEIKTNKSIINTDAMEFTQNVDALCKTSWNVEANKTIMDATAMEFTKNLADFCKSASENTRNKTIMNDSIVEFTQGITELSKIGSDVKINKTHVNVDTMEFTQDVAALCKTKSKVGMNKSLTNVSTMDVAASCKTKPDVKTNKSNLSISTTEFMQGVKTNKTAISANTMEFIGDTSFLCENESESKTNISHINVDKINKILPKIESDIKTNKTSTKAEIMEFTPDVAALCSTRSKIETNKTILNSNSTMESIQDVSAFCKSKHDVRMKILTNANNKEFAQDIPALCKTRSEVVTNKSFKKIDTPFTQEEAALSKTIQNPDMEFTQNVATICKTKPDFSTNKVTQEVASLSKTIQNPDMEFTQNVATICKTKPDSSTDKVMVNNKTDFTNDIIVLDKISYNSVENKTSMNDDTKFSSISPIVENNNINQIENDDLAMDVDMSLTTEIENEKEDELIRCMDVSMEEIQNYETSITKQSATEMNTSHLPITSTTLKTPGSSFHTSFMPFSPCTDDTQHLINCSSTKHPKSDFSKLIAGDLNSSFVNSKIMALSNFGSDVFPVSLENTHNNQTYLDCSANIKDKSCKEYNENKPQQTTYVIDQETTIHSENDVSNKLKRRSSENIESAVECKKHALEDNDCSSFVNQNIKINSIRSDAVLIDELSQYNMESETLNISQENITLSDSVSGVDDSLLRGVEQQVIVDITQNTLNLDTTDCTNEISKSNPVSKREMLWNRYTENSSLRNKIYEFRAKMENKLTAVRDTFKRYEESVDNEVKGLLEPFNEFALEEVKKDSIDSSAECSLSEPPKVSLVESTSTSSGDFEEILTLKEKIEAKCKRNKRYWSIHSMEENKCEFYTFYGAIRLEVQFNKETEIVNKTDVYSIISDDSEPTALFVHKIFMERLSQKNIQSAVGDVYDVLTLLDYVYINMQKMLEILNEFDNFAQRFALKMDQDFRVTLRIVNIPLRSTWCISVDMSDLDNITENSITATAIVGSVKEAEIKSFVNNCPRGISFLKTFINSVLSYIDLLKKRRNYKTTKC